MENPNKPQNRHIAYATRSVRFKYDDDRHSSKYCAYIISYTLMLLPVSNIYGQVIKVYHDVITKLAICFFGGTNGCGFGYLENPLIIPFRNMFKY